MDALFEGRSVPRWLRAFERDPDEALDALLFGRADFAHLSAAEPTDLLLDWLRALGDEFAAACDLALERWIARVWGRPLPATGSATRDALAWLGACELIAGSPALARSADALRARFLAERHVLAALVEGRARDPEGRAWLALARHQRDRALLPEWWRLCSLPPDEPWYRGPYGVHGLEGLPPEQAGRGGVFPDHVAEGLRVLALALHTRERDGWLRPHDGEREFVPVARLTMAAFPFLEKWRAFWREAFRRAPQQGDAVGAWVQRAGVPLATDAQAARDARRALGPDPDWTRRAKDIGGRLPEEGALAEAQRLIDEQERYARATGDAYFVVRSLCSFAARLRRTRPERALAWATLARELEPWNPYTWTTSAECALALGKLPEALDVAVEATRRFPDNAISRNGLAEVLKAKGDLDQAEAVYRETLARFPDNAIARNGLAEVLKATGDLDQAEAVYRETIARFPDNAIARTGLAQILRERGRLPEARTLYQAVLDGAPDAKARQIARLGLDALERRAGADADAATGGASTTAPQATSGSPALLRDAPDAHEPSIPTRADATSEPLRPTDVPHLLADAYLLRRFGMALGDDAAPARNTGGLRLRARGVLIALQPRLERDARAAGVSALTELTLGDLQEAQALLRQAVRRFPGSARVRYADARLARALTQRDASQSLHAQAAWQRLERLDPRFRPVAWLGAGRTWLALPDAEDRAREAFGQLARWLTQPRQAASDERRDASGFADWWAGQVRERVFGALDARRADDLTDLGPLRANLERDASSVDHLEHDLVERFAFV